MTKNYNGKDITRTCAGYTQDGKRCERTVTYSIVKPYTEPMLEATPYCSQHRDQEPENKPLNTPPWVEVEGF